MISFIKGDIAHSGENFVIIECNGLGYQVMMPPQAIGRLSGRAGVKIYTHQIVRDDGAALFGFLSYEELLMFGRLITVSGLGPKSASAVLGQLSPSEITLAILSDDAEALSKAPGVGKKTAQRIILDLKDKLKNDDAFAAAAGGQENFAMAGERSDAAAALVMLGYSRTDALKAVGAVTADGMTTEQIIKAGLKRLSGI